MKIIFLFLLIILSKNCFSQIEEDYIGKWVSQLNEMIYIYPNGSCYAFNENGDWRLTNDGNLEIISSLYRIFFTISNDFNYIILNSYSISGANVRENLKIKYERFSNNSYTDAQYKRMKLRKDLLEEKLRKQEEEEKADIEKQKKQEEEFEMNRMSKIQEIIQIGNNFYYEKKYGSAIEQYELSLLIDFTISLEFCRKNLLNSYLGIGDILFQNGNYSEARNAYTKAQNYSEEDDYSDKIKNCDIKLIESTEKSGDKYFNEGYFDKAIEKYKEIDSNRVEGKLVNKKIALCYEKIGDNNFSVKKYKASILNYEKSLQYFPNVYVQKKISKSRYEIDYLEKLNLNLETEIGVIFTGSDYSKNNFNKYFNTGIGFNLNAGYRINQYIVVGISYYNLAYNLTNPLGLISTYGVDTSMVELVSNFSESSSQHLKMSGLNINTQFGYFYGVLNPYISGGISYNFFNKQNIDVSVYNQTTRKYEDGTYVIDYKNTFGLNYGIGLKAGSKKYSADFSVKWISINSEDILEKFKSVQINLGVIFRFNSF